MQTDKSNNQAPAQHIAKAQTIIEEITFWDTEGIKASLDKLYNSFVVGLNGPMSDLQQVHMNYKLVTDHLSDCESHVMQLSNTENIAA